jgi:hypothetical protein
MTQLETGLQPAPTELKAVPAVTNRMRSNATAFLEALDPDQRQMACFDFDNEGERRDWDFIPKSGRNGLPVRLMSHHQQTLAHQLLACSVALPTYAKVLQIMSNEHILRELQGPRIGPAAGEFRSPGNYFFSIFGKPNMETTWGWRVVGHHVSLNFTVVGGRYLTATPFLLGMEPAEFGVMKPLREDMDLGFDLLALLTDSQRSQALLNATAPPNFATRVVPKLGQEELPGDHELGFDNYVITDDDREALKYVRTAPRGVGATELSDAARAKLIEIVEHHAGRLPEEQAAIEMERAKAAGLDAVHFAWAGAMDRGEPHYYRVQGASFLAEFENAQSGGNHIHVVWRDWRNDFGEDLLATHHAQSHAKTPFVVDRVTSSRP